MKKRKLAIVRGSNLNKWEMQNFEPLEMWFDVVGFNAKKHFFDTSTISFPVRELASSEKSVSQIRGFTTFHKMLFGSSQRLIGLEKALLDFDIVHTVGTETYYTKQCVDAKKRNSKLKVVATIWENIPFAHEDFSQQKKLKEYNLAGIDHFIAMSNRAAYALQIEGVSSEKIDTVYIGVDLDRFKKMEVEVDFYQKLGIKKEDFVVTSIGRHVWEKGIVDTLVGVSDLIKKNLNVKYVVVGKGPLTEKIQSLAKRMGISDNVVVTALPYEDIPKVLNISDLFVLPSIPIRQWQEQLGMAFIEAMACGVAVVAGRSGSIDEVIGDAGVLVPPADPMKIGEAIEKLYSNNSLRDEYAQRGMRRAREMFDSRKKAVDFKSIYDKVAHS